MFMKSARTLAHERRIAGWILRRDTMEPRVRLSLDALIALQLRFHGDLVLPGDPEYQQARQLSSPAYHAFPLVVAQCETSGDVRTALALGALIGLTGYARSEILLYAPLFALIGVRSHPPAKWIRQGGLVLLGAGVVVLPWVVFNSTRFDSMVVMK